MIKPCWVSSSPNRAAAETAAAAARWGNHQRPQQDDEMTSLPQKSRWGESVPGQRGEADNCQHRHERNDDAVAEKRADVEIGDDELIGIQAQRFQHERFAKDLVARAQRRDDHPRQREQRRNREGEQNSVTDGAPRPALHQITVDAPRRPVRWSCVVKALVDIGSRPRQAELNDRPDHCQQQNDDAIAAA